MTRQIKKSQFIFQFEENKAQIGAARTKTLEGNQFNFGNANFNPITTRRKKIIEILDERASATP